MSKIREIENNIIRLDLLLNEDDRHWTPEGLAQFRGYLRYEQERLRTEQIGEKTIPNAERLSQVIG